jgi:hypothetical protein
MSEALEKQPAEHAHDDAWWEAAESQPDRIADVNSDRQYAWCTACRAWADRPTQKYRFDAWDKKYRAHGMGISLEEDKR